MKERFNHHWASTQECLLNMYSCVMCFVNIYPSHTQSVNDQTVSIFNNLVGLQQESCLNKQEIPLDDHTEEEQMCIFFELHPLCPLVIWREFASITLSVTNCNLKKKELLYHELDSLELKALHSALLLIHGPFTGERRKEFCLWFVMATQFEKEQVITRLKS